LGIPDIEMTKGETVPNTHRFVEKIRIALLCRMFLQGLMVLLVSACQALPVSHQPAAQRAEIKGSPTSTPGIMVLDTRNPLSLEAIVPTLAEKRVVFVGETHDRYDHHLNQLAVIKALYARNPKLAIGLEFFQSSFQPVLDDYIAGKINEQTFLQKTEYYDRWQYDYRLYRPIIHFAHENKIPLVALNLPGEITKKVGATGLKSLSEKEKRFIPESINRKVPGYRERIESVFSGHPGMKKRNMDYFIDAQLLWDEGMAEQAAKYLKKKPNKKMVILAGAGHVMFGTGIPVRLQRRINATFATVLTSGGFDVGSEAADYILFSKEKMLPKSGLIGVLLEPAKKGMRIGSFSTNSGAEKAGLAKGDRIVSVGARPVRRISDIRLALWNKKPGDKVKVTVIREASDKEAVNQAFEVTLK
jgi:uncharacterized iron-regulated protein